MKIFLRLTIIYLAIIFFYPFKNSIYISGSITNMTLHENFQTLWISSSLFLGFFIFFYLLYHWARSDFQRKSLKFFWFIVIIFGTMFMFIGPGLYYIFVYELKLGICKVKNNIKS